MEELKARIIQELEDYIADIYMIINDAESRQIDSGDSLDDPDYVEGINYYQRKIQEVENLINDIKK